MLPRPRSVLDDPALFGRRRPAAPTGMMGDLPNFGNEQERAYAKRVFHRYDVHPETIYNTEITFSATIRAAESLQEYGKLYPYGGQNVTAVAQYRTCSLLFEQPEMARYMSQITNEDDESGYLQVVIKAVLLLFDPDIPRTRDYDENLIAFLVRAADNNEMVKSYLLDRNVGPVLGIFDPLLGTNEDFKRLKELLS